MPYKKTTPNALKGKTKLKCNLCKKEYFRVPTAAIKSKFCSNECKWSGNTQKKEGHPGWKGGKLKFKCTLCGKEVERAPSNNRRKYTFCSNSCKNIYYNAHQKVKETDIEIKTKEILEKNSIQYEQQFKIKNICIADFYLPDFKLAIFCDGDYWHKFPLGKPRDKVQIERIKEFGIIGLRFWGSEIMNKDFEGKLLSALKEQKWNKK